MLNLPFKVREFLRAFPTIAEFDEGDTGFFVDVDSAALIFMRHGEESSRLEFSKIMPTDPEGSFEMWRRKFRGTEPWRPGRG